MHCCNLCKCHLGPYCQSHARIQNILSEGVNLNFDVFLVDEGREDSNTTIRRAIIGPPMAFCWRADNDPTLNAGLKAL